MKRLAPLCFFLLTFQCLNGQHYYPNILEYRTVYTPQSSSIEGIVYYPLSSTQYDDAMDYINSIPDIEIVGYPTSTYNCHSYAWNISRNPNAEVVWISENDRNYNPNLQKYWTDGSYIEVSGSSTAEIIHYTEDHSAEKHSSSLYKSKWGANCLVIHAPNNVPSIYGTSGDYYSSIKIDGPTVLCRNTTGTFQTPDYMNSTFTWTIDTNRLELVAGQGTRSLTVTPRPNTFDGNTWISLSLHIGSPINVTRVITNNFWVGVPGAPTVYPSGFPPEPMGIYSYQDIVLIGYPGANFWDANWSSSGSIYTVWSEGQTGRFYSFEEGGAYFYVNTFNSCGNSALYQGEIIVYGDQMERITHNDKDILIAISPNPSTTYFNLELKSQTIYDTFDRYLVEIIDPFSRIVKILTLNGSYNRIDINDLDVGYYLIRLTYGTIVLHKALIVHK